MWIIFPRCQTQIKMVPVNSRQQLSLEFQLCSPLIQSSPKYSSTSSLSLSLTIWLSNKCSSTALGYASSIQMIFLHDLNCNLTMVVLQLVKLRIFSSSRPSGEDVKSDQYISVVFLNLTLTLSFFLHQSNFRGSNWQNKMMSTT